MCLYLLSRQVLGYDADTRWPRDLYVLGKPRKLRAQNIVMETSLMT